MSNEPILPAREVETERERVIERLSVHFANDDLSLEELEQRMARVYAARTPAAIADVLSGLPGPPEPAADAEMASGVVVPAPSASRRTLFALMSGVIRRGAWLVPPRLRAVALMGGVEIDLRVATLQPVTDIYAAAVMGGVVVTVPPDVRVEADGIAILGGFEDQIRQKASLSPGAPLVRIRGFAFMGGVEIKVRKRAGPDAPPATA